MDISDTVLASALTKVKTYEISALPACSEISHTFSADFERKMNILFDSFDKQEKRIRLFSSAHAKAAAILLIICISTFSLAMSHPKARADFKNAVTEFYETHIKFYFITNDETSDAFENYENIYAAYIPEGFALKEKYNEYDSVGYRYECKEKNLVYDVFISLNDGLSVQTDKNNIEEIFISGREAYLISGEHGKTPYSTLIITGNKITVTIYGQLHKEEIIQVGESIQEN